tara:strand:+ start:80 stop:259 length:180 start_codon:yes stop_codon:yes gene_type:complete
MEELRNSLARDINKICELSKGLLTNEQLVKLRADLIASAEATIINQANRQVSKLNEIVK